MIGKTLGHYKVSTQLGRGGMGEVYVADDVNLNRTRLVQNPANYRDRGLVKFSRERASFARTETRNKAL